MQKKAEGEMNPITNYELRITNYVYKVEGRIKRRKAEGGGRNESNYELRDPR